MAYKKVRVAVNGYGVIGKRIADAIVAQDDMELAGVADIVSDWRIKVAVTKGYKVFASSDDPRQKMESARIPVVGTLQDLLKQCDVVCDATSEKNSCGQYGTIQSGRSEVCFSRRREA